MPCLSASWIRYNTEPLKKIDKTLHKLESILPPIASRERLQRFIILALVKQDDDLI
jgi:hypothetical protein